MGSIIPLLVCQSVKSIFSFLSDIVLALVRILLEAAGTHVSEVASETKREADNKIRTRIIVDAQKMLKDYQTIADILKKHAV